MRKIQFSVAVGLGLLLGYMDSRPTWDDTGITAGLLLIASASFGALGPERPWLWALCLGIWIPVFEIANGGNLGALIAPVLAFAGVYGGVLVRRAVTPTDARPRT